MATRAETAALVASLTLDECVARFASADCCLDPVRTLAEALESAHVRARGLVRRDASSNLQALFPARVDGEPPATRPPPAPE